MSCGCGCRRNCGCGCGCTRNCGCGRNCGWGWNDADENAVQGINNFIEPTTQTFRGYVWYEVEARYTGPYFAERRRPEPRNNGCGCGCNN